MAFFTSKINLKNTLGILLLAGLLSAFFPSHVAQAITERGLIIQKTVRNVTRGESAFAEKTRATENEIVEYQVVITTTGTAGQTNVTVRDALSSRLEFSSGDDLRDDGLNLGNLAQGETRTLTYQANVVGFTSSSLTATNIIVNTAKVKSDEVSTRANTAKLIVEGTVRTLTIQKRALNVTNGETAFVETADAKEGDTVRFEVVLTTAGTAGQTNITVRDFLPTRFIFVSGDNLTGGLSVGNLAQNETRTFTFDALVTGTSAATLVNRARVKSNEVSAKYDTAKVKVEKTVSE